MGTSSRLPQSEDLAYQDAILQKVSRTFALTIPQLPEPLCTVVANAYLLCRIADTIEDSDSLDVGEKRRFYAAFVAALEGSGSPEAFGAALAPRLEGSTLEAERELVHNTPRVLRITHGFSAKEQRALAQCVRTMSQGMEEFQRGNVIHGLRDLEHLDAYCYHVAGVVGEMLTELFCAYSPEVAQHRQTLSDLAVSFGQGLQMTNILKDVWDDKDRDMCWLPRGLFAREGFDLRELSQENHTDQGFQTGLKRLVGIALAHLEHALDYTLAVPKSERGIRRFCLWAIGMAVLTLRKLNKHPEFTSGKDVKITRRSVKATILVTNLLGFSNRLLRFAFRAAAAGLPRAAVCPARTRP
ncbi:MAG TPA: phytoene/squalene synthase family protein [Candidatus Hydrogenedentes bacterium]|nr:phytoene/squalene synthase family protein [Candidatus Hydrogenedentota bacterium]HIJ74238.1 phytoene/squalene synthase family protein [Candidatus Hydrogenedentota bacterium]